MGLGVESSSDAKDRNSCWGAVILIWEVSRKELTCSEGVR